jgi:hypothetical protein
LRIVDSKLIENCFEGTDIKEILLDKEISKEFIFYLKGDSFMQYFPMFSKPFFKIDVSGKYIIKGIVGFKTLRIILKQKPTEVYKEFERLVNNFE